MAKLFTKCMLSLSLLTGSGAAFAGITNVEYKLVYNTTTCMYDVMMNILGGSTVSGDEQQAYTAQVSIVIPASNTLDSLTIVPNEPRTGTLNTQVVPSVATRYATPSVWSWTNSTDFNDANNGNAPVRVYAFTVSPSNGFFPPMSATASSGVVNQVKLFSVKVNGNTLCGNGIRLWKNNITQGSSTPAGADPVSSTTGFFGRQYNNGITFSYDPTQSTSGGYRQTYKQNGTTVVPPDPTLSASRVLSGSTLYLTSTATAGSSCAAINPNSYRWEGPNNYMSNLQNSTVTNVVPASFGTYRVSVSDALGCSATLALTAIALPVKLSDFNGNPSGCAAVLSWETASEMSFDRFEVQYSADAKSFAAVGEVAGKKLQNGSSYTYSYSQPAGKGYYRLKMIDLGGMSTFSETISVQTSCGGSAGEIVIVPNPTSGYVSIRGIAAGTEIRVMDMLGKVVASEVSAGTATTVNLASYADGVYNVLVARNGAWEKAGQIVKR